jgi:nucleoside 2-deoxyribosyltransferase
MVKVEIDLGMLMNSCFVIMPFSPTYQTEYDRIIQPAVEAAGLACIRADEIYSRPQITADIWKSLRSARIVIAELTGRNTNVLYEVGLAHALGKTVIIITRNEDDVPFDLKALRYLYYNTDDPSWGENLKEALANMLQKLLKETHYGTVFEDIAVVGKTEYEEQKVLPAEKEKDKPSHDLTGIWRGTMKVEGESYNCKLDLMQQDDTLSGTMAVSFLAEQKRTVVQETMRGEIKGSIINLYGVSYSYLEQGASPGYLLDAFILQISSGGDGMSGGCTDTKGHGGAVSLKRKVK